MDEEQQDRVEAAIRYSDIARQTRNLLLSLLGGIGGIAVLQDAPLEAVRSAFTQYHSLPLAILFAGFLFSFTQEVMSIRKANEPAAGEPIRKEWLGKMSVLVIVLHSTVFLAIFFLLLVAFSLIGLP